MIMGMGFLEMFLVALMGLGGFGVQPNPKAPKAAEVLRYAPGSADVFAFLDVQAILPGTLKILQAAPEHELAGIFPEAREGLRALPQKVEELRSMMRSKLGFDPVADLRWVAVWVRVDEESPSFLVAVAGAPADVVERVAQQGGGQVTRVNGHPFFHREGKRSALGAPARDVVLVGTPAWVKARLAGSWRPASPSKRTVAALSKGAAAALVYRPGVKLLHDIVEELHHDDERVGRALLTGAEEASLTLTAKGLRWSIKTRTEEGYHLAELVSDGLVDVLRAGQPLSRAAVRWGVAALAALPPDLPQRDAVLAHRETLTKFLLGLTGDGKIQLQRKAHPKHRTIAVSATAGHLREVIPMLALGIAAGAGAGFWFLVGSPSPPPPPAKAPGTTAP